MNKKVNYEFILDIVGIILMIALCVCAIYTLVMFITNFGCSPELGIYDTRVYSWALGDSIKYTYTNLNFIEIMKRIW